MKDQQVRIIEICAGYQSMKIFYNDGKSGWKTKRARWFIGPYQSLILNFYVLGVSIDIEKLFLRLEGEITLKPLKEYCTYL